MSHIKNVILGIVLISTISFVASCEPKSNVEKDAVVNVKVDNVSVETVELLVPTGCIGRSWLYKRRVSPAMLSSLARPHINAPANRSQINTNLMIAIADYYVHDYGDVKRLLDSNVDVNETNSSGCTALIWAIVFKRRQIVSLLLEKGADTEQSDTKGMTPLMFAALATDLDIFQKLLAVGANVNASQTGGKNEIGTTVLHHAVTRKDNAAIVKMIIENGADVQASNETGRTPLLKAAWWGGVEYVTPLLDAGADINHASNFGGTALYEATSTSRDNVDMIRLLISKGANVKAATKKGETPLMNAARWGNLEHAKVLIEAGADKDRKSNSGQTALDFARQRKQSEVIAYLDSLE